ncbi:hypothetical protein PG994_014413 [Apiospora phragmitis]|uniref:Uncharacterized protein n=1 Tax=Apiospora phragmitis TaxID=2905665 RepID=A0ABR1T5V0_9PEZI
MWLPLRPDILSVLPGEQHALLLLDQILKVSNLAVDIKQVKSVASQTASNLFHHLPQPGLDVFLVKQ